MCMGNYTMMDELVATLHKNWIDMGRGKVVYKQMRQVSEVEDLEQLNDQRWQLQIKDRFTYII